ncbi:hypothetical protein BSM4216_0611 [Bacillus smithii]|nr:hypothetical protein BSM4216_0611 [Bacillus smithii]
MNCPLHCELILRNHKLAKDEFYRLDKPNGHSLFRIEQDEKLAVGLPILLCFTGWVAFQELLNQ